MRLFNFALTNSSTENCRNYCCKNININFQPGSIVKQPNYPNLFNIIIEYFIAFHEENAEYKFVFFMLIVPLVALNLCNYAI